MSAIERAIDFVSDMISEHIDDGNYTELCRWLTMSDFLVKIVKEKDG